MKLSENLKKIRKDNNLSQEQLAEKLGVSRQAVSKWESNQSYPEMDKVLLICKMFNYNIDTLMNNDIVDVKEAEQAKTNLNKFVEDFFDFITKTTKMFYSMKFFQIIKCLFEQFINVVILFIISLFIGGIGEMIFSGIFVFLPGKAFNILESFVSAVYIAFATALSVIVFLHIFKIRYLDYYEFVEENDAEIKNTKANKNANEETLQVEKRERINSKKEKIIIRDPNHNPFGFLKIITKFVIFGLKAMAILFVILPAAVALIGEVASIILLFTIAKSGLLFYGLELGSISAIIFTIIVLILSYNFVTSKKVRLKMMGISFIVGCVLCGIAIALGILGISKFERINEILPNDVEASQTFTMNDKLVVGISKKTINYIEKSDAENNVEVVVKHPQKYIVNIVSSSNKIKILEYANGKKSLSLFEDFTNMINNKQIIHSIDQEEIEVYATQDNINKLKENYNKISHN